MTSSKPDITINACGILPMSKFNNTIYVLCGREQIINGWEGSGKWCGFGGHKEQNETNRRCAARECYEETMGFIGTQNELFSQLNTKHQNFIGTMQSGTYMCYYIMIPYDEKLPEIYRNVYKYMEQCNAISSDTLSNGCFEKPFIRWYKLSELLKYANNPSSYTKKTFRDGFLSMLVRFLENNNL